MKNAKPSNRMNRIDDELKRELSIIFLEGLNDPRISSVTTVLHVNTSRDLKYSNIYLSVLGNEAEKKSTLEGIKSANGFIRKQIAQNMNLRTTPELRFFLDDSLEQSMKIESLIKQINKDKTIDEY